MQKQLPEPFPSAPGRPPVYVLYCARRSEEGEVVIQTFCEAYAAKKFLEAIASQWVVEKTDLLRTDTGWRVRCDKLQDVLSHKYSKLEKEWELPHPYDERALWMRTGQKVERRAETVRPKKERRARGERKPRASRDGLISVGQIAEELGVTPRECRGVLRALKMPKPDAGWAWSPDEAAKVKEQIAGGLKKK